MYVKLESFAVQNIFGNSRTQITIQTLCYSKIGSNVHVEQVSRTLNQRMSRLFWPIVVYCCESQTETV